MTTYMTSLTTLLKETLGPDFEKPPGVIRKTFHINDTPLRDRLRKAVACALSEGDLASEDKAIEILPHGVRTPGAVVHLWPYQQFPIPRFNRLLVGISRQHVKRFDEVKEAEKLVHMAHDRRADAGVSSQRHHAGWLIGALLINRWISTPDTATTAEPWLDIVKLTSDTMYLSNSAEGRCSGEAFTQRLLEALKAISLPVNSDLATRRQRLTLIDDTDIKNALDALGVTLHFSPVKGTYIMSTPTKELHVTDPSYQQPTMEPTSPEPTVDETPDNQDCSVSDVNRLLDTLTGYLSDICEKGPTFIPHYVDDIDVLHAVLDTKEKERIAYLLEQAEGRKPRGGAHQLNLRQQLAALLELLGDLFKAEPVMDWMYTIRFDHVAGFRIAYIKNHHTGTEYALNVTEEEDPLELDPSDHSTFTVSTYGRYLTRQWLSGHYTVPVVYHRLIRYLFVENNDGSWQGVNGVGDEALLEEINSVCDFQHDTLKEAVQEITQHLSQFLQVGRKGLAFLRLMIEREITIFSKTSGYYVLAMAGRNRDLEIHFSGSVMEPPAMSSENNDTTSTAHVVVDNTDIHSGPEEDDVAAEIAEQLSSQEEGYDEETEVMNDGEQRALAVEQADMISTMFRRFTKSTLGHGGNLIRRRLEDFSQQEGYEFDLEVVGIFLEEELDEKEKGNVFAYMEDSTQVVYFNTVQPIEDLYRI